MNGSRFDAWTRRGLGLAAAGLVASLSGAPGFGATDAEAKKKRCRKLQQACKPGARKKRCCKGQGLLCEIVVGLEGRHCCLGVGAACTETADCCGFLDCGGGTCNE